MPTMLKLCVVVLALALALTFLATNVRAADFDPYEMNGGLVSAVAGKNFVVVAADTRMIGAGGYLLASRNHLSCRLWSVDDSMASTMKEMEATLRSQPELMLSEVEPMHRYRLPQAPIWIGSAGCSADCEALQRVVRADLRASSYLGQSKRFQPDQVATLLSQILYLRRGFPYYSFCVVSGMDVFDGSGAVYVYDAIGSYERVAVASSGTGREALQPILDRLFVSEQRLQVEGTADQAVDVLCQAYRSVSEREIGVGDKLVLHVSEKAPDGSVDCRVVVVPLKEH